MTETTTAETHSTSHRSTFLPAWQYYAPRLTEQWGRARETARYADIGEFSPENFRHHPVTSKDELKSDPWGFSRIQVGQAFRYYETTGTSGLVTPTPRTREDVESNISAVAGAWGRLIAGNDRVLSLLPSDIVPVGDLITGVSERLGVVHSRAYPYAEGISGWDRILGLWSTLRPTVVFAAPGVFRELTKLLMSRGLLDEVAAPVRLVMLLGEVSGPALRRRLGQWWQASVLDASYGSTESGTLATGCPEGQLHLLPMSNHFEILDEAGAVQPVRSDAVQSGRLVVTPLNGHARPLLRFDLGDRVVVGEPCPCDNAFPSLRVLGRGSEAIVAPGGAMSVADLEDDVFGLTQALGYLVEVEDLARTERLRVLLERVPGLARGEEAVQGQNLGERLSRRHGLGEVSVRWLNNLPASTRSGASQKNWKSSNVRVGTW